MLLESNGFAFLQNKVQSIQESDAKYKKPATRKRRAATDRAPAAKRRQTKKTEAKQPEPAAAVDSKAKAPVIQEDDDYDESESE